VPVRAPSSQRSAYSRNVSDVGEITVRLRTPTRVSSRQAIASLRREAAVEDRVPQRR
jgi:hypothetical protein